MLVPDFKAKRRFSKCYDLISSISRLDVPIYSANASYFLILAAFPTVMLLLNLLSYTSFTSNTLLDLLSGVIPHAIMPAVSRIITGMYESSSSTLVSVSALTALWAASRGIYGMITGLNRIYAVQENRGYVFTRLLSVVYTFLFLLVLLLTLALHVFGQTILNLIPETNIVFLQFLLDVIPFRFLILLVLQTALFTAMFMFLPNRRNRFWASFPGAVLAALGWQVYSWAFSLYMSHFSRYDTIYGSLSVVALTMLWLYVCMEIVFYGGALNKYLADVGYMAKSSKK